MGGLIHGVSHASSVVCPPFACTAGGRGVAVGDIAGPGGGHGTGRRCRRRRRTDRSGSTFACATGGDSALRGGVQRHQAGVRRPGRRPQADAIGRARLAAGSGPAQCLSRQGRCGKFQRADQRRLRRHRRGAVAAAGWFAAGDRADRRHAGSTRGHPCRRHHHGHRRQAAVRAGRHAHAARQPGHARGADHRARRPGQAFRRDAQPRNHPRHQCALEDARTRLRLCAHQHLPGRHRPGFRHPTGQTAGAGRRQAARPGAGSAQQSRRSVVRGGTGGRRPARCRHHRQHARAHPDQRCGVQGIAGRPHERGAGRGAG